MEKIPENEQWKLEGKCSICRRNNYCSKPCSKNKRRTHAIIRNSVETAIDDITGGAYSRIMENSFYKKF